MNDGVAKMKSEMNKSFLESCAAGQRSRSVHVSHREK